ncbi:MAG TPA: protein kinase, partial [Holophagaceae bacterium]|nr:protein kinase [Holophagaceae bacterium]
GLPSASVWSLQPEGAPARALWIGTDGGLVRLGFGGWLQAGPGQGLADASVYGLCVPTAPALAGSAWFGTRSALYRFQGGRAQAVPLPGGAGSFAILEWEGALYAGDRSGGLLRSRDGRRFERVSTPPDLARANLRCLTAMPDHEGRSCLWAVTGDHGLWCWDGRTWTRTLGLPAALHAVLRTSDGALWVGTERGGLVRIGPEGVRTFGLADGLPNLTVMSLAEIRREGRPWLCAGTEGGGLLLAPLSAAPAWRILSTASEPALPNDTVYQLRQDRAGRLYAFTNQGVARLSFPGAELRIETFGVADGLPGPEFNGGASTVDAEGRIWAGNAAGVAMFDPARELPPGPVPPLELTAPWPEGARLGWRDRSQRFTYRLETLAKADQVRYRTQLVGLEEAPTPWTAEASREFPGLAPGTYTFRVEARLPDGRETPARERTFTLPPPPWASPWAYGAYGLAGLALITLLVRLRLATLRRRTEELEALVAERTSEVEGQKQHIEAQNRRIAGLLERGGLAQHDLMGWAKAIGREVADALSAEEVGLFMVQEEGLRALAESGVRAPSLEELQAGGTGRAWSGPERRQEDRPVAEDRRRQVLPVRGSAGELLGGVVVKGAPPLGALERQLVDAFAAQMGAVLELHRTKQTLQAARARQAEAKASLQAKGIALLHLCPVCRRCYPDAVTHCPEDGAALELPRLLPLVLAGRYRLERLLGEGGMGLVFGAVDERLGREVAVKLLKPEVYAASAVQARFQQEARMLAALAHPGIIAIFDSGELEDGHAYLVMERLHGAPLGALLERHGAGSPRQVASLLRQTAAALVAAHRAGIVHRDLKPDNVFLVPAGEGFQAKLLDFGLAKALDATGGVTRTGMVVGTPQYMSPEQVRGQALDGRSDLYALAALAYEAISGRRLIRTEFAMEVFSAIARGQHTPLAEVVPVGTAVAERVEQGLALDPAARPGDLEAWAAALAEALEALPPGPAPGWPPIPAEGFAGPRPIEGTEPTAQLPRG